MSLKSIKEKLDILGYDVKLVEDVFLSVGKILKPSEIEEGIFLFDLYCRVTVEKKGVYLIYYGTRNYQPSVEMSSESEVIDWIKKEYPKQ